MLTLRIFIQNICESTIEAVVLTWLANISKNPGKQKYCIFLLKFKEKEKLNQEFILPRIFLFLIFDKELVSLLCKNNYFLSILKGSWEINMIFVIFPMNMIPFLAIAQLSMKFAWVYTHFSFCHDDITQLKGEESCSNQKVVHSF